MNRVKLALAFLVVGLMVGFVPVYWRSLEAEQRTRQDIERLERELARSNERLQISRLQGQLGTLLIEVQRQNFGEAGARSTTFFDALFQATETIQDGQTKTTLRAIGKHRDSITSGIAKADPETSKVLQQLYLDLGSAAAPE